MSKRDRYFVRKFAETFGTKGIMCEITEENGAVWVNFEFGRESFCKTIWGTDTSEDQDDFYDAVQFFNLLRKIGEEGVDELTARWLVLKEAENAETKGSVSQRQESGIEESDRVDSSGAAEDMQEESCPHQVSTEEDSDLIQIELDFDSEAEERE